MWNKKDKNRAGERKKKKRRGAYDAARFDLEDLLELDEEEEFLREDADSVTDDPEEPDEEPIEDLAESLDGEVYDRAGREESLSEEAEPSENAEEEELLTDAEVLEYTQEWERIPDDIIDLEPSEPETEPEEYDAYEDDYDDEVEYYDEDDEEEDGDGEARPAVRRRRREKLSPFETAAIAMSVVLAVTAVSLVGMFLRLRARNERLDEFKSIGRDLNGVKTIGGEGLEAVRLAAAERQALVGLDIFPEFEPETEEAEVEEEEETVEVSMNLTTIKSDIKVKFVNDKTGKLVPNVPFEVAVKTPEGEERSWEDDDKDGIIYRNDIIAGKWTLTMKDPQGDFAGKYLVNTKEQTVDVKDTIEYKKVDVTDEVKKESQVNVAAEDTEPKEAAVVESENIDTVEWFESSREEIGEDEGNFEYIEVDRDSLKKPNYVLGARRAEAGLNSQPGDKLSVGSSISISVERDFSIHSINSVDVSPYDAVDVYWGGSESGLELTIRANEAGSGKTVTITIDGATEDGSSSWNYYINIPESASSAAAGDSATDGATADASAGSSENAGTGATDTSSAEGSTASDQASTASSEASTASSDASVSASVKRRIKVSPSEMTLTVGNRGSIKVTLEGIDEDELVFSSSDDEVATVDNEGVITAVESGRADIRVADRGDSSIYAVCAVTVPGGGTLKTTDDETVYVRDGEGGYREASASDFDSAEQFFVKRTAKRYIYHGWQTIDGHTYYYNGEGKPVTGDQVILGVRYSFNSEGMLATGTGALGVDVSTWNGAIDWNAVKNSGITYAIIRCGFRGTATGVLVEDSRFHTNMRGALGAGLKVGVYFYSSAVSDIEAVEEASMAASMCSGYRLSYPVFLDVERSSSGSGRADKLSSSDRTAIIKAFCATMENSGYRAGLYANKNWMEEMIETPSLTGYKLWLAQYAATPSYSRTRYDMWQYTSKGSIGGISGSVDLNISYLNY